MKFATLITPPYVYECLRIAWRKTWASSHGSPTVQQLNLHFARGISGE